MTILLVISLSQFRGGRYMQKDLPTIDKSFRKLYAFTLWVYVEVSV